MKEKIEIRVGQIWQDSWGREWQMIYFDGKQWCMGWRKAMHRQLYFSEKWILKNMKLIAK